MTRRDEILEEMASLQDELDSLPKEEDVQDQIDTLEDVITDLRSELDWIRAELSQYRQQREHNDHRIQRLENSVAMLTFPRSDSLVTWQGTRTGPGFSIPSDTPE